MLYCMIVFCCLLLVVVLVVGFVMVVVDVFILFFYVDVNYGLQVVIVYGEVVVNFCDKVVVVDDGKYGKVI